MKLSFRIHITSPTNMSNPYLSLHMLHICTPLYAARVCVCVYYIGCVKPIYKWCIVRDKQPRHLLSVSEFLSILYRALLSLQLLLTSVGVDLWIERENAAKSAQCIYLLHSLQWMCVKTTTFYSNFSSLIRWFRSPRWWTNKYISWSIIHIYLWDEATFVFSEWRS